MIEASCERERESRWATWHRYEHIISIENLLAAWEEFLRGKRQRRDVVAFSLHLIDRIVALHKECALKSYRHGPYQSFIINDPKTRHIHKASVRDRLLHHALHRKLYPFFDRFFIHDSYSCRKEKGMHRALDRLREFARKVSRNDTRTAWVLQCDIRKFFASIDHAVLMQILRKYISDEDTLWLLGQIVDSFHTEENEGIGLPLGNLTSQLLVNVYMNEFDQFMKRSLREKYYIRYADDFVVLHHDRQHLEKLLPRISAFLQTELQLSLHPLKVRIKTVASGIDFLGWMHFPDHRVLRTATKRRMIRKLRLCCTSECATSYAGLLSHGNTWKLREKVMQNHPIKC